jgi:hypothetical protein
LSSKIARALGTVVMAAAPFIMLTAPAATATGGCAVDNTSGSSTTTVTVSYPPLSIVFSSTSRNCSYVSGGGTVNWSCTLTAGECELTQSGNTSGTVGTCITAAGGTCRGHFEVAPGATVTLTVTGGRGVVADAV